MSETQTPSKRPRRNNNRQRRNLTFNSNIEHHQIYDYIAEDLVEFHEYFIRNLNRLNLTFKTRNGNEKNEYSVCHS